MGKIRGNMNTCGGFHLPSSECKVLGPHGDLQYVDGGPSIIHVRSFPTVQRKHKVNSKVDIT